MPLLLIIQVVIFGAVVKLLVSTEKPGLCAGLYAVALGVFSFVFGVPWLGVTIGTGIAFAYSWLHFWLLVRFLGTGAIWYAILIGGFLLPAAVRFALRV